MTYLEKNEGRHPTTAHRRYLEDYALPYFVNANNYETLSQTPPCAVSPIGLNKSQECPQSSSSGLTNLWTNFGAGLSKRGWVIEVEGSLSETSLFFQNFAGMVEKFQFYVVPRHAPRGVFYRQPFHGKSVHGVSYIAPAIPAFSSASNKYLSTSAGISSSGQP